MLICFTGLTICTAEFVKTKSPAAGKVTILFVFLDSAFYAIGFASVMFLYCTEIVPHCHQVESSFAVGDHSAVDVSAQLHAGWELVSNVSRRITFNTYVNPIAFLAPQLEVLHHLRLFYRGYRPVYLFFRARNQGIYA